MSRSHLLRRKLHFKNDLAPSKGVKKLPKWEENESIIHGCFLPIIIQALMMAADHDVKSPVVLIERTKETTVSDMVEVFDVVLKGAQKAHNLLLDIAVIT